jgi:hypothetical protein
MYLYYIHFFFIFLQGRGTLFFFRGGVLYFSSGEGYFIFLQGRGTLFFFRGGVLSYICIFITVINYCIRAPCRAGLKLIEQIAPNWAPGA